MLVTGRLLIVALIFATAACSRESPPASDESPSLTLRHDSAEAVPDAAAEHHRAVVHEVARTVLAEAPHRAVGVVLVEGGRAQSFAYGPRNATARFGADTSFEIGSVSKVFVGLLLANAVRRSELGLDDSVTGHLPPELVLAHGEGVTLRDLATHAVGFSMMPTNWTGLDPATHRTTYTQESFRVYLADFEALHAPRAGYSYSNVGPALLASILSHRAQLSFRDLLAERLLLPLGMRSSDYRDRPLATDNVLAGYDEHDVLRPKRVDASPIGPCCAVSTTLRDMSRFLEAALDPTHELAEDFRLTTQVHHTHGRARVGLGWDIDERWGFARKNGQVAGYRTHVVLDARNGRALFVVVNSESADIDALADGLVEALFSAVPPGARERYRQSQVAGLPSDVAPANVAFEDPAFGAAIELAGWKAPSTVRAGETIEVELYWRCRRSVDEDWQVFVHGDQRGARRIGADHFPGSSSTRLWEPGVIVRDSFAIPIPERQPTGSFTLFVGLYRGAARMPASQDGVPVPDSRVRGPSVQVRPAR
jgi:CubicO group peptidase (beta-lactamase class C family)